MAGTYVQGHSPALGAVDPDAVAEAKAAHAAGEQAAMDRRGHYHENVLGQGAQAGDPQDAESSLQSFTPDSPNEGAVDAVMDAQEEWLAERNAVIRRQRIEREEAAERAGEEARQAAAEAQRDVLWDTARRTGRPVPSTHDILQRARGMSGAEDGWDAAASYGSSTRPAMFVSMPDGAQVEVTARPRAGVARSASDIRTDALLRQARELSADSFMAVQIARSARHRRSEASRGGEAVASRSYRRDTGAGPGPELTRTTAYGDDGVLRSYGPEITR